MRRTYILFALTLTLLSASCAQRQPDYGVKSWATTDANSGQTSLAQNPDGALFFLNTSMGEAQALRRCTSSSPSGEVVLKGCIGGLEQAKTVLAGEGLYFQDERACREQTDRLINQRVDMFRSVAAWCEASYVDAHDRASCRDAAAIFFGSLNDADICHNGPKQPNIPLQPGQKAPNPAPWERERVSSQYIPSEQEMRSIYPSIRQDTPKIGSGPKVAAPAKAAPAKIESSPVPTVAPALNTGTPTQATPPVPTGSTGQSSSAGNRPNANPTYIVPQAQTPTPAVAVEPRPDALRQNSETGGISATGQERTLTPGTSATPAASTPQPTPPATQIPVETRPTDESLAAPEAEATDPVGPIVTNTQPEPAGPVPAPEAEPEQNATPEQQNAFRQLSRDQDWPVPASILEIED